MNKPKNENYAAVVVELTTLIPLADCNKVQAAIIMGQQVVVGLDAKVGDIGLYFPVETALSKEYLTANNLYRDKTLNVDNTKAGYFESHGRIKCVKFRGHKSEGLFMPLESLGFLDKGFSPLSQLKKGDCFDELANVPICHKYVSTKSKSQGTPGTGKKGKGKLAKESKLIDNQFRFHDDTSMLYRNLHKVNPTDLISITYKMHGTSGISAKILCKKPLKWYEKLANKFVQVVDTQYDYIYSSRKVIKNPDLNPDAEHFYGTDIWGLAHNKVKEFLQDGMTFYYEIVGYLPSGAYIQGPFDYGQEPGSFGIYIYRITYTNPSGKVFEFSAHQVQDYCKSLGLNVVPELYYGRAKDLYDGNITEGSISMVKPDEWRNTFLEFLKITYNEKDCYMCVNKVPEEGVVIRLEKNDVEAYKCKSTRFYEFETAELDKGEANIEDEN